MLNYEIEEQQLAGGGLQLVFQKQGSRISLVFFTIFFIPAFLLLFLLSMSSLGDPPLYLGFLLFPAALLAAYVTYLFLNHSILIITFDNTGIRYERKLRKKTYELKKIPLLEIDEFAFESGLRFKISDAFNPTNFIAFPGSFSTFDSVRNSVSVRVSNKKKFLVANALFGNNDQRQQLADRLQKKLHGFKKDALPTTSQDNSHGD